MIARVWKGIALTERANDYLTKTQRFILSQKLDNDYYYTVLTSLKNGKVLITGGYDPAIQPTDQAWVYN